MSNGVLETVGKTEKTEYCDDGKENAFKKEENKIFNQEIGDKFDNLKSKIQNYNYDIYGNYEQQKNELVSVAGVEFESYKDNYYSKFDALVSEYPCQPSTTISREKTLNNYYDSLLDETEKKLENQAKMAEQNGRADIARNIKNTISDINQDYNNLKETTSSEYDKKVTEFLNTKITNTGCESILGDVVDIVDEIFGIIKIVAPILLIVFGSLDFGQAVLQDNQDALKKATSKFIKRAIATVVIFFVPLLVRLVLRLPGMEELGLPDDPLCGLSKVVLK